MIKISTKEFFNYLKLFANLFDKEEIATIYSNKDLSNSSEDTINEIFLEALDNADLQFIFDHELFFLIFDKRPALQNDFMIGEMNSSWSLDKKRELFDFLNRNLH